MNKIVHFLVPSQPNGVLRGYIFNAPAASSRMRAKMRVWGAVSAQRAIHSTPYARDVQKIISCDYTLFIRINKVITHRNSKSKTHGLAKTVHEYATNTRTGHPQAPISCIRVKNSWMVIFSAKQNSLVNRKRRMRRSDLEIAGNVGFYFTGSIAIPFSGDAFGVMYESHDDMSFFKPCQAAEMDWIKWDLTDKLQ